MRELVRLETGFLFKKSIIFKNMEDIKNFISAIAQIAEERNISEAAVIEGVEAAIAAAYRKEYGEKGQQIRAKLDLKTGALEFWQVKLVVDDDMIYSEEELEALKEKREGRDAGEIERVSMPDEKKKIRFNGERHIMMEEAKGLEPKIKQGEELKIPLEARTDYGRIAAQAAKQVILQKVKEAERKATLDEYKGREGEIISGVVQRAEPRNVYFDIGKVSGILAKEEMIPGEFYRPGQRFKLYVLRVEESAKGPVIFLSRAYPKIVSKLFELEVPEIANGEVEIKSIAREAGSRTKIAVESKVEGVDSIGSAVGQRGVRVLSVIDELGGEKIDIIEYSDDPVKFIANALSPAKVLEVEILGQNKALCIVPEDQLSLAIGRDGQNVRLAAHLTGWKIDVRGQGEERKTGSQEGAESDKKEGKETVVVEGAKKKEKKPAEKTKAKTKTKTATKTKVKAKTKTKTKVKPKTRKSQKADGSKK